MKTSVQVTLHPVESSGELTELRQKIRRLCVEVESVAEDLGSGAADDVPGGGLVAFGVDQMADREAQDGAVGEELVEVGVRVTLGLLSLVLGIDDGHRRASSVPDDVRFQVDLLGFVEKVGPLAAESATV